jgi:hypothetical protein
MNVILYVFIYTICLCKQAGPIYSILDREHNHWKLLKQEGTIENRNIIQIVYETEGHLAVYGQVCRPEIIIWTSASFRSICV